MPTPRKYATNAERQAAYRAAPRRLCPPDRSHPRPRARRRWTVLIGQARGLLEEVAEEMATSERLSEK